MHLFQNSAFPTIIVCDHVLGGGAVTIWDRMIKKQFPER